MDVSKKHSAQRDGAERKGPNSTSSRSANLPRPLMAGAIFRPWLPMHCWDQMKPRTVYEKGGEDFTETARRLARQHKRFRQASFAEFEMMMGFDDEALKRYGLPNPMVKRALLDACG